MRTSAQVDKEHRWLPILAPPGSGLPRPWSVYRWLAGQHAATDRIGDLSLLATDLADFLAALYKIDPSDGPEPGAHNFFRGGPLSTYDSATRETISALKAELDTGAARRCGKQPWRPRIWSPTTGAWATTTDPRRA